MEKGHSKTIFLAFILLVLFVAEYWYYILPVVAIGLCIYLYPKWSHSELQKKSLEVDIKQKENQIELSKEEIKLKQMQLQAQLLELQSKMNKREAKTEQIELTNEVIKKKLGENSISNYNKQIDNLQ